MEQACKLGIEFYNSGFEMECKFSLKSNILHSRRNKIHYKNSNIKRKVSKRER